MTSCFSIDFPMHSANPFAFDLAHARRGFGYRIAKRIFDFLLAALGLLMVAPLLPVLYLWVRLDSPGPGIYRQRRLGRGGREFDVLKFRTMRQDAEKDGPVWARPEDDRRTRSGRVLRKLYLDELPQLWNILVGEMSFVGPRPERPHFYPICEKSAPGFGRRLEAPPGLTGLAQVFQPHHAKRRELRRKYRFDMLYLVRRSFLLDLWIIGKTFGLVWSECKELMR